MKHETQTTQTTQPTQPELPFDAAGESVPPAVAGGPTAASASTGLINDNVQPPATAGGTDKAHTTDPTLAELRSENERLRKQLQEQTAHASLKEKLKQAGARTPKLLLEAAKHALEYTVAGELANAAEIVDSLMQKFPEQFGTHTAPSIPSIDAGAGRVSKPSLTREALSKMSPAEVAQLDWNDVRRVLSSK